MASNRRTSPQAAAIMNRLLAGKRVAHVVRAAAELGLADHLEDERPLDVQSIAEATSTHAPSLARLLRALAAIGIVHETDDRRYRLTPVGATLRTNAADSMRASVDLFYDELIERPWLALPHAVRTGELAFRQVFGTDLWTYLSDHPVSSNLFDRQQQNNTQVVNASLISCYPFGSFKWIVDVGGGIGSLLIPILEQNAEMRGTIFELPQVAAHARQRVAAAGLASRCEVIGGDALISVPSGADGYMLKSVIHNWEDAQALRILQNCRSAMQVHGKVIVIERLLSERADPGDEQALGKFLSDIMMMLLAGGRERTEEEFKTLLAEAGLRLNRLVPTAGLPSIIEAVPI